MKWTLKKNERGQATVEAVLLITIFLAVSLTISKSFSTNDFFASIIEGPWDYVDGMVRDGVWMKSTSSHAFNPNARSRHSSKQDSQHFPNPVFDQNESALKQ